MAQPPLRVGIVLDRTVGGGRAPAWLARTLGDLVRSDFIDLCMVVWMDGRPSSASSLLLGMYERADRWVFVRAHNDAFAPSDLSPHLKTVPAWHATSGGGPSGFALPAPAIEAIRGAQLDVLLHFAAGPLGDDLLRSARFGTWSLHHGDGEAYCDGPPGFWEIADDVPVTGAVLCVAGAPGHGVAVLDRTYSATHPYSLFLNRNHARWKSSGFMVRALKRLHQRGGLTLASDPPSNAVGAHRPKGEPSAAAIVRFTVRVAWRYLVDGLTRNLFDEQWQIGYRPLRADTLPHAGDKEPFTFLDMGPRSHADPFPIAIRGGVHVFYEQADVRNGKGGIVHAAVSREGGVTAPQVVLEEAFHVSYPLVFEWDGEVFMLPESRLNRSVSLYRAAPFPAHWVHTKTILTNINATDPTLFEHEGRFWLFVCVSASGGPAVDELYLFMADTPLGEWTPHPLNPVVSDVRRARPAGRVFVSGGGLIRPSQDCTIHYGRRLQFNRIVTLSPTDYHEEHVGTFDPASLPGRFACHTYNVCEGTEWIDALRRVPRWPSFGGRS